MATFVPILFSAILLLVPSAAAFDLGINCGGPSSVNASSGAIYSPGNNYTSSTNASMVYQADAFYSGTDLRIVSYGNLSTNASFSGVPDVALYATERTGQLIRYDVNVPNGNYSVALIIGNVARTLRPSPRIQVQNVIVDQGGVTPIVEPNATVNPSIVEILTAQASVTTGLLSIVLTAAGAPARISAIRISDNSTTSNSSLALPTSFAINSGGAAIGNYTADAYYYGTSTTILSTAQFFIATPQQDARTGPDFGYALNLARGNYEVDLDFGTGLFNTTGQPIVLIQGVPVTLPANASSLTTAAYVSNGLLTIGLRGANGSNATVASVNVVPSGNSRLVAVAAGSPQDVLSGRGIVFSRDQYFTGGTNYSLASNVTLPSYRSAEVNSDLYKNGRTGNFSYSLPVGLAGTYLVDLHFADPVASGAGQRVFNVSAQNVIVAPNVDIYATTGANFTALVLQVPVNLTQGGNLTLSFAGTSPLPPLLNAVFVHSAPGPIPAIAPAPAPAPNLQTPVTSAASPQVAPAVAPATSAGTAVPSPAVTAVTAGPASAPTATSAFGFLAPSQAGSFPSGATGLIAGVPVLSQSPPAVNNGKFSFAVLCGGFSDYVSTFGVTFKADDTPCLNLRDMPPGAPYCRFDDNGANGGFAASTEQTITGTTDPKIFQAERIGTNHYLIVVPAGRYSVNTFFAEISPNDTTIFNVNEPGQRVLNIEYLGIQEGATIGVDPFKDAGGKFKAAPVRARTVQLDGPNLEVYFRGTGTRDEPKISAIWVYSTDSPLS